MQSSAKEQKSSPVQVNQQSVLLDISADAKESIHDLINRRCSAAPIVPELVMEKEVRHPESYNRFRELEMKALYRKK